ncbi:MAG: DsrE family protein [Oleispira sp.]|nr:DsrE family protein [Oleispira sp.]
MTLIIISSAPTLDLEPVELLLALAAFEQQPSILLLGEGIFHGNTLQQCKRSNGKAASKIMSALPMYDCEEIFIYQADIERFGLETDILQPFCTLLDQQQLQQLIQQSKHCVNL